MSTDYPYLAVEVVALILTAVVFTALGYVVHELYEARWSRVIFKSEEAEEGT